MTAGRVLRSAVLSLVAVTVSCSTGPVSHATSVTSPSPSPTPLHLNRAYVATGAGVLPIDLTTKAPGKPIPSPAGTVPVAVSITADGKTAYVSVLEPSGNHGASGVMPLDLVTATFGDNIPISTTKLPFGVILAPGGKIAYVVASLTNGSGAVIPLDLTTKLLGTPILTPAGTFPVDMGITPDGKTAYLAVDAAVNGAINAVIPIDLVTQSLGTPIPSPPGTYPVSIAISLDGNTAYVAYGAPLGGAATSVVIPIDLKTMSPGPNIGGTVGSDLSDGNYNARLVIISPDGKAAYVIQEDRSGTAARLIPVDLTGPSPQIKRANPISLGATVNSVAIAPDGKTAYLTVTQSAQPNTIGVLNLVIPVDLATLSLETPIVLNSTALGIDVTP
jgi:DNA-binding beta-propeller fold protein YncE